MKLPGSVARERARPAADGAARKRFVVGAPAYAPQYAQLYFCRLAALRAPVTEAARAAWGPDLRYADRVLGAARGALPAEESDGGNGRRFCGSMRKGLAV
jgi:hypothetical protein